MFGSSKPLYQFLGRQSTKLTIPVYQRNYDWKIEQCQRLLDDLISLTNKDNKDANHFFGCIVSMNLNKQEDLIIDGQQRITTVSLVLIAIYNLLNKEQQLSEDDTYTKNSIIKEYLLQPDSKDQKLKLQHIKKDQKAFESLFNQDSIPIKGSSITNNYNFFRNQLNEKTINELMEIFNAVRRLEIIHVELDKNDDDPQLIFESLNSTGLALNEGDKIRNYILMNLFDEQEKCFEDYWVPISELTHNDVGSFVRIYLGMVNKVTPKEEKVYEEFKVFFKNQNKERKEILKDLFYYSKLYNKLLDPSFEDKETSNCIDRLNRLETSVCRPFFLEVLELNEKGNLSDDDIKTIFLTIESFIVRRIICDVGTAALRALFLALHREIFNYDSSTNNYVEKLKYNLTHKRGVTRFPLDNEFIEKFQNKDIYTMSPKNKKYLLERFENGETKETNDIYKKFDDGEYSIDHIMPQQMSDAWKKELGNDCNRIHDQWLHKMSNLTITAYNSSYRNKSFNDKKNAENGYLYSHIHMNKEIAEFDKWDEDALIKRQQKLMEYAKDIWKYPETTFHPVAKPMDSFSLSEYIESEEDVTGTGKRPTSFTYMNQTHSCEAWSELLSSIMKILYAEDNNPIDKILFEGAESIPKSAHSLLKSITLEKDKCIRPYEFADGMYIDTNKSADTIIKFISKLFELYEIDPEDLTITLMPS